jgi:hypothetical protein
MKEKPKKTGENFLKRHIGFLGVFVCFTVVAFSIIFIVGMTSPAQHPFGRVFVFAWLYALGWAVAGTLLITFVHWVWSGRNFKRFLFGVACVATLIALAYAEEDLRGKLDWDSYKHQLEAKGEKLDFSDFVPAAVPDDQNFAMTPIVSTSYGNILTSDGKIIPYEKRDKNYVGRMGMSPLDNNDYKSINGAGNWQIATMSDLSGWQSYYRTLAAKTNEFPIPAQPQTPAADVLLALSKYDPAIEELRQAAQMPDSRFPLNYDDEDPSEILLPHLAALKQCSQVLQLRALAELQNNQIGKAFDDIKLMLRLADSVRTEPFIITHLVRIAIVQMALQPVYEGLANHQWSDAQLAEMDSELAEFDFLADFKLSINGERAAHVKVTAWLEHNPRRLQDFWTDISPDHRADYFSPLFLVPRGWFYQNDITMSKLHDLWLSGPVNDEQQIVSPQQVSHADNALLREIRHLTAFNFLARILVPQLGPFARRVAYAQNAVNMARIAMALERYRMVHGGFPGSLDALTPQFMQQLPHDIINGNDLQYRLTQDGQFVLYSVGWNERDDGGVVAYRKSANKHATENVDVTMGDWVWKYPQK